MIHHVESPEINNYGQLTFNKDAKAILEDRIVFLANCASTIEI